MNELVITNIVQRPVRTLISILGVALGVVLVMLFTGLSRGMSNDLQRRSGNLRAEIIFTRSGSMELTSSTANVSTQYVERLKEIDGVESAVAVIRYVSTGGKGFGFEQVEGVDWRSFAAMNNMQILNGRAPEAVDEIVIDETKARDRELKVGSTLNLFGNKPYKVVGIYAPESGARVKMALSAMQDALEAPGKCTYILVKTKDGRDPVEIAKIIDKELPGNKIQMTSDVMVSIEKKIPFLGVFLKVLVGLGAVVSGLVIMLAMYTTITERTREIGILKALGASRGYIISVIEQEAIIISILGLIVGFIASFIAGSLIHKYYGLIFEYGWDWALAAAAIGLLGSILGALYPAVRAANLDPVNALAYE
jgi:putative ABC transport system permease protein